MAENGNSIIPTFSEKRRKPFLHTSVNQVFSSTWPAADTP